MSKIKHYDTARHERWRAIVLRRAGYLCEECKRYGRRTPATIAHHIKPVEQYPELKMDTNNGQALCEACHNKKHPEKGKKRYPPPLTHQNKNPTDWIGSPFPSPS